MKLKNKYFNSVQNHIFQFHSKSYSNEIIKYFYRTALFEAIEKENIVIVKLLLANDKIDVNILNIIFFIFNKIEYYIF